VCCVRATHLDFERRGGRGMRMRYWRHFGEALLCSCASGTGPPTPCARRHERKHRPLVFRIKMDSQTEQIASTRADNKSLWWLLQEATLFLQSMALKQSMARRDFTWCSRHRTTCKEPEGHTTDKKKGIKGNYMGMNKPMKWGAVPATSLTKNLSIVSRAFR